ncbi:MAG: hypothetical protein H0V70_25825 [Ktedonobacteraceae bacterium]|nr:hypothetical protein [Ktedonobacteraceae bacterium]
MSTRGTLPTIEYRLTDPKVVKDVPAFVLAKVKSVLEYRRYVEEDLPDADSLCYAEVRGCLASPIEDVTKSLMIQIANPGYAIHFIYPGGAVAWILTDNPLSFERIPDHLLPPMRELDTSVWWIVSNTDEEIWPRVVKVHVVTEDQMTEAFPDLW